jgi:triosephosphate isomerase
MRRAIIAGNWKMYKTLRESAELAGGIKRELYDWERSDIVLCPAFTSLSVVSDAIEGSNIHLGAQDVFWEHEGAYTGEISPEMLVDAGCRYVIIGHSERRQFFRETNEMINKKIKASLAGGLVPIMCVGENLGEREKGTTLEVVKSHVEDGLRGVSADDVIKIVIAYEPVWAIGTGKTATSAQAQEVHKYIREILSGIYTDKVSQMVRIQYGGSVKPGNIAELVKEEDIDGALVGGASLSCDSFVQIVRNSRCVEDSVGRKSQEREL